MKEKVRVIVYATVAAIVILCTYFALNIVDRMVRVALLESCTHSLSMKEAGENPDQSCAILLSK